MTGVIQPKDGLIFLREVEGELIKVIVCTRTLQVKSEEPLKEIPKEWTDKDVKDLLDEGCRFFGDY